MVPAVSFSQGHEHEAGRDGRYDNAKRYLSSAFLSSLVGLSLTLTLGRLPPSLSPGCAVVIDPTCADASPACAALPDGGGDGC